MFVELSWLRWTSQSDSQTAGDDSKPAGVAVLIGPCFLNANQLMKLFWSRWATLVQTMLVRLSLIQVGFLVQNKLMKMRDCLSDSKQVAEAVLVQLVCIIRNKLKFTSTQ